MRHRLSPFIGSIVAIVMQHHPRSIHHSISSPYIMPSREDNGVRNLKKYTFPHLSLSKFLTPSCFYKLIILFHGDSIPKIMIHLVFPTSPMRQGMPVRGSEALNIYLDMEAGPRENRKSPSTSKALRAFKQLDLLFCSQIVSKHRNLDSYQHFFSGCLRCMT